MLGRVYVILDSFYVDGKDMRDICEKVLKGGAEVIQIRAKDWDKIKIKEVSKEIYPICKGFDVPLIVNDHIDIGSDFDGAHIGKDDVDHKIARKYLKDKILGVSCYGDLDLAIKLQNEGVDYVAFSSPYPSPTKDKEITSFELFRKAKENLRIPFYAIGGIDDERAKEIVKWGAYGVAVVSYVLTAKDPEEATKRLKDAVYSSI